ncbi:hypothetical protein A7982_12303 [Minicystis rosea]|nr:hypothetical protein A7982_12303 [Minicystis rosea]
MPGERHQLLPRTGEKVPGGTVKAKIVDENGLPIDKATVFICGTDTCSPAKPTDSNGEVTIDANTSMKNPAFKFGDSLAHAELAIPLPDTTTTPTTDFTGHVLATAKLSDKPGAPLTPGTTATSGDVSIAVPTNAAVTFSPLHATCEDQLFRAVSIPLTNIGPVIDPAVGAPANLALLYGVGAQDTTICPAAKVTVALPHKTKTPNDLDWAPGADVEFWILSTDAGQTYAPYAGWAKMSDGKVSEDGTKVSTNDGAKQGFVFLANFAIRLKP